MVDRKYDLVVGAIFKNEEHSIVEWLEHNLYHGVEHFYLIDDDSNDRTIEKIKPYMDKGLVTLFNHGNQWSKYLGRQRGMYNHYIFPRLKETQWLLMIDVDEYMWSPIHVNLRELLMRHCMHIGQIQVHNTLFGSSGFIEQPKSIVGSFFMRSSEHPTMTNGLGLLKYFVNSNFEFIGLNVHHATFVHKEDEVNNFLLVQNEYFILNHYRTQSLEFWKNVKCTRGDVDNYTMQTMDNFRKYDVNEVEDKRLYEQNKELLEKLSLI